MNLKVYGNGTYEEEKALVDVDTGKVLLQGDYYHDKIDYKIDGYLLALFHKGIIEYTELETEWITPEHGMFDDLEFYNDDEE